MKKILFSLVIISFFLSSGKTFAQDTLGGTVKYMQITKLDFSGRKGRGMDDQRFKDFIADLPEESKIVKTLYFTEKASLYEEVAAENASVDPKERRAAMFMSMGRKPKASVEKVYIDLENSKKTELLMFMTRNFIVESDIEAKSWKLSNEMKKIQGFTCMKAEMIITKDSARTDSIVAWFTPEIPLSIGPENYTGLPGLVMAVEKNRETILLASTVEMTLPKDGTIVVPSDGKKVTKEELDQIIKEKIEEFKASGGGMGPGGGRPH
ncbi:MAG: hypothetical protein A2W91_10935 [Bacteroidetes bacterium GWF2_38_335]|nr:MAG: hypothetical protein A2W91_10935 [Bacteroidetes bacterium GWF2_38_335]OFY81784.1 MAG: hypothetical protein A2281_06105 [Bacteroidetes bacterium RIFOXYA12_FULL_38_20]HBS87854.1 hypothetical protein [Bacteroidales bacterium]